MVDIRSICYNNKPILVAFWFVHIPISVLCKEEQKQSQIIYNFNLHIVSILLLMEKCEIKNKSGIRMALPYSNQVGQILPPPPTYGYVLESQNRAIRKIPQKIRQIATIFLDMYHRFATNCHLNWFPLSHQFMVVDNFCCQVKKSSMDKIPDLQDSIKNLFVKILGSII